MAYTSKILLHIVVKWWAIRFREDQESFKGDSRPGRPVEVITEDKVVLIFDTTFRRIICHPLGSQTL